MGRGTSDGKGKEGRKKGREGEERREEEGVMREVIERRKRRRRRVWGEKARRAKSSVGTGLGGERHIGTVPCVTWGGMGEGEREALGRKKRGRVHRVGRERE